MEQLDRTVDAIRQRYGAAAITFGSILHNDIGIELDEQNDETADE
jgi:hypothetical protein